MTQEKRRKAIAELKIAINSAQIAGDHWSDIDEMKARLNELEELDKLK